MQPNVKKLSTDLKAKQISGSRKESSSFIVETLPFKIESPQQHKLDGVIYEQTILERPEDESFLLKQSGISLNTTNLISGNPLMQSELESVLSLQPEKLDIKNL